MAHLMARDGVKLFYEDTGGGLPVIFVHEFFCATYYNSSTQSDLKRHQLIYLEQKNE